MTRPRYYFDEAGGAFVLLARYLYRDTLTGDGRTSFLIPEGFRWRGSVPRLARWLIETVEVGDRPTLGHDYLYQCNGRPPGCDRVYTRAEVDLLFLLEMLREGVDVDTAVWAYRAVRLCGWWPWWLAGRRLKRQHVAA